MKTLCANVCLQKYAANACGFVQTLTISVTGAHQSAKDTLTAEGQNGQEVSSIRVFFRYCTSTLPGDVMISATAKYVQSNFTTHYLTDTYKGPD
ncbi:hypothetical protein Bpfe_004136 [Biomphalaria pfeifferi]|uniref:Uncharacterized protein n=1 Tax=Biomphalaria pfeifferi TaxID=112525 RepID=A0AAD8C5A0_BIOPF|nr:hypothetical protein Bpfe_004136 [Biomphalaria pfeifferi]